MQTHVHVPPPQSPLAGIVLAIWRVDARGTFRRETILPKGNVDLLFNLGSRIDVDGDGIGAAAVPAESAAIVGLQTLALVTRPAAEVCLLGVSLHMERAGQVLPLPAGGLLDLSVEAQDLFRDARELTGRLASLRTFSEQCQLLTQWLIGQLRSGDEALWVATACRWLQRTADAAPVRAIARASGISERQVRRRFHQHLGLGPAGYLRIERFARALQLMSSVERLTDVAHQARYFDQAHLCREFREMALMSPSDYRTRQRHVVGHIFE